MFSSFSELIEDPVKEERERRRKAVEKWTKESNDKFASGYKKKIKQEPIDGFTLMGS